MEKILGLLLLVVFIVTIVGLAAAVTYAVIKIFPTQRGPKTPDTSDSAPPASEEGAGRLFRRAKREAN